MTRSVQHKVIFGIQLSRVIYFTIIRFGYFLRVCSIMFAMALALFGFIFLMYNYPWIATLIAGIVALIFVIVRCYDIAKDDVKEEQSRLDELENRLKG